MLLHNSSQRNVDVAKPDKQKEQIYFVKRGKERERQRQRSKAESLASTGI